MSAIIITNIFGAVTEAQLQPCMAPAMPGGHLQRSSRNGKHQLPPRGPRSSGVPGSVARSCYRPALQEDKTAREGMRASNTYRRLIAFSAPLIWSSGCTWKRLSIERHRTCDSALGPRVLQSVLCCLLGSHLTLQVQPVPRHH